MTREGAIATALNAVDSGEFRQTMARRVAIQSESQNPEKRPELLRYLQEELQTALSGMGFECRLMEEAQSGASFLYAERFEGAGLPTVLGYGHGDVVRGMPDKWDAGLDPWVLTEREGTWFARGIADNKVQHSINLLAQASVLQTRGQLGFNAKWLFEVGEEVASPGLHRFCETHRELLAADVLICSDGPRLSEAKPTIFLGSRGEYNLDLSITARDAGHHSGNWGGLLSNPGVQLCHAIASLVGATGRIQVPALVPAAPIAADVKASLSGLTLEQGPAAPRIDPDWGEPGLSGPEKVFGWSAFELLAMGAGNPFAPVGAIPPTAWARCQLRFVEGVDIANVVPAIEAHLVQHGFGMVKVEIAEPPMPPTRVALDNPWVHWAVASIRDSVDLEPDLLPNIGGTLPNDAFALTLGLPTLWIPHAYAGSRQHAPNENVPVHIIRQAVQLMAGLYWDVGNMDREAPGADRLTPAKPVSS